MKTRWNLPTFALVTILIFTTLGSASSQAPAKSQVLHVHGAIPIQYDKSMLIDVSSPAFKSKTDSALTVTVMEGVFHLSADNDLKAGFEAQVVEWVNTNYWISVAVFDSQGRLLGTAAQVVTVKRSFFDTPSINPNPVSLDFGVSESFRNARYFVVSISNRNREEQKATNPDYPRDNPDQLIKQPPQH